jgi:ubiquitin conjugation factor E4 B
MINLQSVMLRFAEPFMDAKYSKASLLHLTIDSTLIFKAQIDRIDPLYFAHSSRIDVKEETRIKATSDEASTWAKENGSPNGIVHLVPYCKRYTDPLGQLRRQTLYPIYFI